jgi:hypothetical protein
MEASGCTASLISSEPQMNRRWQNDIGQLPTDLPSLLTSPTSPRGDCSPCSRKFGVYPCRPRAILIGKLRFEADFHTAGIIASNKSSTTIILLMETIKVRYRGSRGAASDGTRRQNGMGAIAGRGTEEGSCPGPQSIELGRFRCSSACPSWTNSHLFRPLRTSAR